MPESMKFHPHKHSLSSQVHESKLSVTGRQVVILFSLGCVSAFQHAGVSLVSIKRQAAVSSCFGRATGSLRDVKRRTILRNAEGQESPTEDNESTVEISKEELIKLAEQAGVKIKFASDYLQEQGATPVKQQQPAGPSMFEPVINALQPILKLPPILQYPALLLIFGAVSAIFLPLFGSGSIKDMRSDSPPPVASTANPEAAKKMPTAADPSNDLAPKVLQIKRKSCDVFPYSLTPTCTDPDIGNKAILKNLDKYAKPPASMLKEKAEQAK